MTAQLKSTVAAGDPDELLATPGHSQAAYAEAGSRPMHIAGQLAAVPNSSLTSPVNQRAHVEVIVIGAGLSGLQAAHDLQRSDVSCLVLEARNRVGGKTWSVPVQGGRGVADLGAAWINDVNQPRAYALARRLGLELIEQNITGNVMMQGTGPFPYGGVPGFELEEDRRSFVKVRDEMERLCQAVDVDRPHKSHPEYAKMSVDELVRSMGASEQVRSVASIWTKAMLGKDSADTSATYFLLYCKAGGGFLQMRSDGKGGGQALRFRKGTQSLARGLAKELQPGTLLLEHPVSQVKELGGQTCEVMCEDGTRFSCGRVIVSVPSPLYKDITFSPPLSKDKQRLAAGTSFGFYGKCILVYSEPWWRELGFCGLLQATTGPFSIARDTSCDQDGIYELTCFVVGSTGQAWSGLSAPKRQSSVLEHLDAVYGRKCPEPLEAMESRWIDEVYFKGAPCPTTDADTMPLLDVEPYKPEGRLHFIGTETSPIWKGYMEGALTSGTRGADEILGALRKPAEEEKVKANAKL